MAFCCLAGTLNYFSFRQLVGLLLPFECAFCVVNGSMDLEFMVRIDMLPYALSLLVSLANQREREKERGREGEYMCVCVCWFDC